MRNTNQVQPFSSLAAWAGIAAGVSVFAAIPLYFIHDGPPPAENVFTRCLITLFTAAFMLVFFSGFTQLIRNQGANHEWQASLFWGTSLLYVGFVFMSAAHEAGVAFHAPGVDDPTTDGLLADANILIHGSIKRILTAVLLLAAVWSTRILPGWLRYAAWMIALANLVFVPSMYFGKDPTAFYSAVGWGNTAFIGSLIIYWIIAVAIVILRRAKGAESNRHL